MKATYHGPLTGLTLPDGREILLSPGQEVEVPQTPEVKTLVALGRLVPVEADAKAAKSDTAEPKKKGGQ